MSTGAWVAIAAVVVALAFGLYRARTDGRFRGSSPAKTTESVDESATGEAGAAPSLLAGTPWADQVGDRATLLQFSSAFCAPCRATRRILTDVADQEPGIAHIEVDAEEHLDVVRRLGIMRTPTTIVLDPVGRELGRAVGAPSKAQVLASLPDDAMSPHDGRRSHDADVTQASAGRRSYCGAHVDDLADEAPSSGLLLHALVAVSLLLTPEAFPSLPPGVVACPRSTSKPTSASTGAGHRPAWPAVHAPRSLRWCSVVVLVTAPSAFAVSAAGRADRALRRGRGARGAAHAARMALPHRRASASRRRPTSWRTRPRRASRRRSAWPSASSA